MPIEITRKKISSPQFDIWFGELQKILRHDDRITFIGVRGGAVLDHLLGLQPNDIDLFYDLKPGLNTCICKELDELIKHEHIFDGSEVDVEASLEKEPNNGAIARTCGYYSFHTEYNSMFLFGSDGMVYGHRLGWQGLDDKIYRYRPQNLTMWLGFPKEKDLKSPFEYFLADVVRVIAYCVKRGLTPDDATVERLHNLSLVVKKVSKPTEQLVQYTRSKLTKEKIAAFHTRIYKLDPAVYDWYIGVIGPSRTYDNRS